MTTKDFSITGNIVDIISKQIFTAEVTVAERKIKSITPIESKDDLEYGFILPDKVANLQEGIPQPHFDFPVGIIRGDLKVKMGIKLNIITQ